MIHYRSIADLSRTVHAELHRLPRDCDAVVGIPRSGMLPASLIAQALDLPLTEVESFAEGITLARGTSRVTPGAAPASVRRVLVVDDSSHTGTSIRDARARLARARPDVGLLVCVVYGDDEADDADIVLEVVGQPRLFEWNVMHHEFLVRCCVDIDGVLCCDPGAEENDDGPRYEAFLESAAPLVLPAWPIGWLVTSRLEQHRGATEAWLEAHGVAYGRLEMLAGVTAAERRRRSMHAAFKGKVYRDCSAELFIESDERQAAEIATIVGKPVLCFTTGEMFRPGSSLLSAGQTARIGLRRFVGRVSRRVLPERAFRRLRSALQLRG